MELNINFANKIGPYDMFLNKCAPGKFCHVEMSLEIDRGMFRVLVDSCIQDAFAPNTLQAILTRTDKVDMKTLHVCFYIMWGGVVSVRFLHHLSEDELMQPPKEPLYETVRIPLNEDIMEKVVCYNLRQLGRPYDIPRAVCLLSLYTLRLHGAPDKFFCSQLVMHTFKNCDLFTKSIECQPNINHMTPSNVYDWLVKQPLTPEEEEESCAKE